MAKIVCSSCAFEMPYGSSHCTQCGRPLTDLGLQFYYASNAIVILGAIIIGWWLAFDLRSPKFEHHSYPFLVVGLILILGGAWWSQRLRKLRSPSPRVGGILILTGLAVSILLIAGPKLLKGPHFFDGILFYMRFLGPALMFCGAVLSIVQGRVNLKPPQHSPSASQPADHEE